MVDKSSRVILEKVQKAFEAMEDLEKKGLGNQGLLYDLDLETIIIIREKLARIEAARANCLLRLIRPEFVRSKQSHSASNTAAKKAFKAAKAAGGKPALKKKPVLVKPVIKSEAVPTTTSHFGPPGIPGGVK